MRDYRGRLIQYKDGQRVLRKPKKKIADCFETHTVTWFLPCQTLKGEAREILFVTGTAEKQFRQENNKLFIFEQ